MSTDRMSGFRPRRVFVLGGTGTIGRAVVQALVERGHHVVCFVGAGAGDSSKSRPGRTDTSSSAAEVRVGEVTDPVALARDGLRGEQFDVLVSCLASRTGAPQDAWRIDHDAHVAALGAAKAVGVGHMILLSAICVQKPVLAFQQAKLAFEQLLAGSGMDYTIVRPTAFFKLLSGQVERVKRGKPFLVFGDGQLTACKPISDGDLAAYLADCIDNEDRRNRILPIGGPGEAIIPKMQGEQLFAMLGRPPRLKQVPVTLLDGVIVVLATLGRLLPALSAKAELARIGRYYATESMLLLDTKTGQYDACGTPSTGEETLFDYYAHLLRGEALAERGEHAVF